MATKHPQEMTRNELDILTALLALSTAVAEISSTLPSGDTRSKVLKQLSEADASVRSIIARQLGEEVKPL